jgi:Asp-tRNA(Asn)/Glu-tRNA(Gln) amidotransferase A subunit family amidase
VLTILTFLTLAAANMVVNLASHPTAGRPARKGEVENVTWGTAQKGEKITAADYVRATQTMHRLGRQMAAFHAGYDVLLTPGLGTLPPKLGWIDMMLVSSASSTREAGGRHAASLAGPSRIAPAHHQR